MAWLYSITSLVVANLLPLYGVFFWGWNVFSLMLLYWLESLIIGVFNILKINKAEGKKLTELDAKMFGQKVNDADPFALATFFAFHYGLFMLVHLIFIFTFFFSPSLDLISLVFAFLSLCLSHYVSFQGHYLGNQEYKRVSSDDLFMRPYPRILIMHFTILFGSWLAFGVGEAKWALGLMVVLKILTDLGIHTWMHWGKGKSRI